MNGCMRRDMAKNDGESTDKGESIMWSLHPRHNHEDAKGDETWQMGPKSRPTLVELDTLHITQVGDVDSAKSTAYVKIAMWLTWKDPRLIGWNKGVSGRPLPEDLWQPRPLLEESRAGFEVHTSEFRLEDDKTGLVYALLCYEGVVNNNMDLHDFPVDMDDLELTFSAALSWNAKSQQTNVASKKDYRLVAQNVMWSYNAPKGNIPDWTIEGLKLQYVRQEHVQDVVRFKLALRRKSMYYVWKVVAPLFMTVLLATCAFQYDKTALDARLGHVTTLLLSTFALLFVIGQDLPKTDFLTAIDFVTTTTMMLLVLAGGLCCYIEHLEAGGDHELADLLNYAGASAVPSIFLVVTTWQLLPGWTRRRRALKLARKEAVEKHGCPKDEVPWKQCSTSDYVRRILQHPSGRYVWEGAYEEQCNYELLRLGTHKQATGGEGAQRALTEAQQQARKMLETAETCGIVRKVFKDIPKYKYRTLAREEYEVFVKDHKATLLRANGKPMAAHESDKLPTAEELKKAGIELPTDIDYWVPVRRDDKIANEQHDYTQLGGGWDGKWKQRKDFLIQEDYVEYMSRMLRQHPGFVVKRREDSTETSKQIPDGIGVCTLPRKRRNSKDSSEETDGKDIMYTFSWSNVDEGSNGHATSSSTKHEIFTFADLAALEIVSSTERYCSHVDLHGDAQWMNNCFPWTVIPAAFIFVKIDESKRNVTQNPVGPHNEALVV